MPLQIDRLKALLQEDLKDLTRLSEILINERSSLEERSSTTLQQITSDKSACLKTVEYRAKEKARLFVDAGYTIKAGEFEKVVSTISDPALHALWKEVSQKLKHCKDQNTINGTVVSHSLKRVNKIMNIIRGQHNKPNLYGSSGKEHAIGGLNSIAKA